MKSAIKNNGGSIFIKLSFNVQMYYYQVNSEAKLLMEELKVDTVKN